MKKILIFVFAVLFSVLTYGQIPLNTLLMPDLTTNFPLALPAYSLVYVESNTTLYTITSYYTTADDVQQAITDGNATAYAAGGANLWTSPAPGLITPIGGVTAVGINNAAPAHALDVTGNALVSDTIFGTSSNLRISNGQLVGGLATSSASGTNSLSWGNNSDANGTHSYTFGRTAQGNGDYSFTQGYTVTSTGDYTNSSGFQIVGKLFGSLTRGSGRFSTSGDAQTSMLTARTDTTHSAATWFPLYLNRTSIQMTIDASTAWTFEISIVGITEDAAKQWSYTIVGLIERDAANNTTLAASSVTTVFESDSDFDAKVIADDTNEALEIQVQDATSGGDKVRWVARIELTEVTF